MIDISNIRELEKLLGITLSRYYPEKEVEHPGIALSQLSSNLREFVVKGDGLAIEDACRIISHDPHLPFGKLIKSDLSRALKKSAKFISNQDRGIIVRVTAALLSLEFCPRETEDYCKLVKKLGVKEIRQMLEMAKPVDEKSKVLVAGLEVAT